MIRMKPETVVDMVLGSHASGVAEGTRIGRGDTERRVTESVSALLAENSKLKSELNTKEQEDSFMEVRQERKRIVAALDEYLKKTGRSEMFGEIVFALALGGL